MAATEESKQSLFADRDGKPMEFHMSPCPQKEILNPLVEVRKFHAIGEKPIWTTRELPTLGNAD